MDGGGDFVDGGFDHDHGHSSHYDDDHYHNNPYHGNTGHHDNIFNDNSHDNFHHNHDNGHHHDNLHHDDPRHDNSRHDHAHDKAHSKPSGEHSREPSTNHNHHEGKKAGHEHVKTGHATNKKTAEVINDILKSEEKHGFFSKLLGKAIKNFKNSTPKMQIAKGVALAGSAILAVSGMTNLITINSDKSAEKDQNKKGQSWKEAGKIGAAAAITYFSVLKGDGKAISSGK
jgi:hypothetical protein